MSLLSVVRNVAGELGLVSNASAIPAVLQSGVPLLADLGALANREVRALRDRGQTRSWQALRREYVFSTVASQVGYAVPADWAWPVDETWFNRTRRWPLIGPLTPARWQFYQSTVVTGPRQAFIQRGNLILITPTPSAIETLGGEYTSKLAVLPQTWLTGTSFAPGAGVSYALGVTGLNCYTTTAGGTSGATPPTHTSGTVSDGGVAWTWASNGQETYQLDTDYCLIDEKLVELGLKWRWLESKNLDYSETFREWDREVEKALARDGGSAVLYAGDDAPDMQFPYLGTQEGSWPAS